MNQAYLLIGGNVGDRLSNLKTAISHISTQCGSILTSSSVYETAAWGKQDQANFLNQVLFIETNFSPTKLLDTILSIELAMGRVRTEKYAERTIDIDILYFNDLLLETQDLMLPHPRISQRKFVLVPLNEIAPEMLDKRTGLTVQAMLETCNDVLPVKKFPTDVDNKHP